MELPTQNLLNHAVSNFQNGDFEQAKRLLKMLLHLDTKNFNALFLFGVISGIENQHTKALSFFEKAEKVEPHNKLLLFNKAKALSELNRDNEALNIYALLTTLNTKSSEAWFGYGKSLEKLGHIDDAIKKYNQAIATNNNYPEALANKGLLLHHLKNYEAAIRCYEQAIQINEKIPEIWKYLGHVLDDLNFYENALSCYEKALNLNPNIDWAFGDYLHIKMRICDWSNFEENIAICQDKIQKHQKVIGPFQLLGLIDNPELQKQCAEIYTKNLSVDKQQPLPPQEKTASKIRVGYLSPDFRNHPVSYLIAEVIESHNIEKFETFGISIGQKKDDEMHQRLTKSFNHFIDCNHKNDDEISKLLKNLRLDIIIDLAGHTKSNRLDLLARRLAPIQINYLGYPGTIGSNCIDYIIADRNVIQPENTQFYSEKIIYLPNCFQANDSTRFIPQNVLRRTDVGLPEEKFVFCCFNNTYKFNPKIFDIWKKILVETPNSVLWFTTSNQLAEKNIKKEFIKRGIHEHRIIFASRCNYHEYLDRYCLADLFLDTLPFNAGTTASDALWAGLPVLTQSGNSFSGRMATSLLSTLALNNLITSTSDEYISRAVDLYQNKERLNGIKKQIMLLRKTNPLFDGKLFTKHLEQALEDAFNANRKNLLPSLI